MRISASRKPSGRLLMRREHIIRRSASAEAAVKLRRLKRILSGVLLMGFIAAEWSCAGRERNLKKTDRMMAYIREKYPGDNFSFLRTTGGHIGSGDAKILVKSEKYPGTAVRVILVEDEKESFFYDSYLGVKFEEDVRRRLHEILTGAYGGELRLFYRPDDLACTLNGSESTSLEQYMAAQSSGIRFTAAVSEPADFSEERETEVLEGLFPEMALKGSIYYFSPESEISARNDEELLMMIRKKEYTAAVDFRKRSPDGGMETDWRE